MSLLSPLFLLGLLGIALPLWLHRLQTQTTDREKFSSTMFLEPSRQRVHVQRRLRYLLLLALRILLLAALVFAFARPVLQLPPQAAMADSDTQHVVVIDTSFSMRHEDRFDQALTRAGELIGNLGAGDQASLFSASGRVTPLVAEPTADSTRLRQALGGLAPDNGRLDLGAMMTALNNLIADSGGALRLHLISDFQASGQPTRFADLIPDLTNRGPLELSLHQVSSSDIPNWLVESVDVQGDQAVVTVRGYNTDADQRQVQLIVNGEVQGDAEIDVAANGSATHRFDGLDLARGDNRVDARLLPADDLPADDLRHAVADNSPPAPVLLLTARPDSLAVTYITAALSTAPRPYQAEVVELSDLDPRILQRYPWVLVQDIGAVNQSLEQALTDYVRGGGAVLAALGERGEGLSRIPVAGQTVDNRPNDARQRRRITSVDTSHPVLGDSAGWTDVVVNRALPIEAGDADRVLMTLAGETPFLLERDIERGRFLLLNARLDNTWTDLPLKPVFVGFLAEAARYLADDNVLERQQMADSLLQLPASGGASGQVMGPDGNSLLSLADTTQAQEVRLERTGYYRVVTPAAERLVAVNPDPRESDLTLMTTQVLRNWQNTVAEAAAPQATTATGTAAADTAPGPQLDIWRYLLILLVILVLAESMLGNRYLRFKTGAPS